MQAIAIASSGNPVAVVAGKDGDVVIEYSVLVATCYQQKWSQLVKELVLGLSPKCFQSITTHQSTIVPCRNPHLTLELPKDRITISLLFFNKTTDMGFKWIQMEHGLVTSNRKFKSPEHNGNKLNKPSNIIYLLNCSKTRPCYRTLQQPSKSKNISFDTCLRSYEEFNVKARQTTKFKPSASPSPSAISDRRKQPVKGIAGSNRRHPLNPSSSTCDRRLRIPAGDQRTCDIRLRRRVFFADQQFEFLQGFAGQIEFDSFKQFWHAKD
ncbi:hypothetical protein LXL04_018752 [Taraxacum kok-saghyz]